jgi:hypothetical protein
MSFCTYTYLRGEEMTSGFKAVKNRLALSFRASIYSFVETNRFKGGSYIQDLLTQGNIKQQIAK